MSTRSIIARYTLADKNNPSEWEGRYCHWDGYPSHMGEALQWIVSRDGYEKAGREIMKHEWSAIDPHRTRDEWIELRSDQWTIVEGYGIAYEKRADDIDYTFKSTEINDVFESWCEWLYIITPENTIEVYSITGGTLEQQGEPIKANLPTEVLK